MVDVDIDSFNASAFKVVLEGLLGVAVVEVRAASGSTVVNATLESHNRATAEASNDFFNSPIASISASLSLPVTSSSSTMTVRVLPMPMQPPLPGNPLMTLNEDETTNTALTASTGPGGIDLVLYVLIPLLACCGVCCAGCTCVAYRQREAKKSGQKPWFGRLQIKRRPVGDEDVPKGRIELRRTSSRSGQPETVEGRVVDVGIARCSRAGDREGHSRASSPASSNGNGAPSPQPQEPEPPGLLEPPARSLSWPRRSKLNVGRKAFGSPWSSARRPGTDPKKKQPNTPEGEERPVLPEVRAWHWSKFWERFLRV